jgi:hypothetical protein
MDPVVSSLFQTHQLGSDGFNWWVGQVESKKGDDPKKSGRYKVRIVGQHLKDCNAVPTAELPWANVMLPVTTPFTEGGTTGATVNLIQGTWVIGFYIDNDKQKPIIMGSIGQNAGATIQTNEDPNPGETCKSFIPYLDPKMVPQQDRPIGQQDGKDKKTKANTDKGEVTGSYANEEGGAPPVLMGANAEWSETNPVGSKTCVTLAKPKCGNESNLKEGITNVIGDLLAANQAAGGKIGDFYVSKVNGLLYDAIGTARYHIGRVVRLVRAFIAKIKSGVVNLLRDGIKQLIDLLLIEETVVGNTGPLLDADKAFKPVKVKGNRFKAVKKIFDKVFEALGCTIEDLTDRIAQWLTDFLWGLISEAFSAAACLIDSIVEGILNQILGAIEGVLGLILGPLQSILSALASGANLIGAAINTVLSFLGISCTGPAKGCEKTQKKCSDGSGKEQKKDALDELLEKLESGTSSGITGVCDDAKDYSPPKDTGVIFVGGIPKDPPPSDPRSPDGPDDGTPSSFFPRDQDESGIIPDITIDTGGDPTEDLLPDEPTDEPDEDDFRPAEPGRVLYKVSANKTNVVEGETITYTIKTVNVPNNTLVNYTLIGTEIDEKDIVGGNLSGSVKVTLYDSRTIPSVDESGNPTTITIPYCQGTTQITIAEDDVVENQLQTLRFTIDGSDAFVDVLISPESEIIPDINTDVVSVPTYSVTADKTQYLEGEDIVYSIETTNVEDGTIINYTIYGDVSPSDFINNSLTGTAVIRDNKGKVVLGIQEDLEIENKERVIFVLDNKGVSVEVLILNKLIEDPNTIILDDGTIQTTVTTTFPDGSTNTVVTTEQPEEPVVEPRVPQLDPPVAGDPITDDGGSIISVPISEKGSPFTEPPFVIFTGQGFGATGIALLDGDGFVSEIRLTRTGVGYKVNKPQDKGLDCVIDSYTLLSPGIGYTSPPKVYINGDPNLAESVIDSNGFLVSVRPLDRTTTFTEIPEIIIIGGGGAGASVLPNLVCLPPQELEKNGYVKIGTGKYIDCP